MRTRAQLYGPSSKRSGGTVLNTGIGNQTPSNNLKDCSTLISCSVRTKMPGRLGSQKPSPFLSAIRRRNGPLIAEETKLPLPFSRHSLSFQLIVNAKSMNCTPLFMTNESSLPKLCNSGNMCYLSFISLMLIS